MAKKYIREMQPIVIETDDDGNIVIWRPDERAEITDSTAVLITPEQLPLVCEWLQEASQSILEGGAYGKAT
jgi:hypothetical protein